MFPKVQNSITDLSAALSQSQIAPPTSGGKAFLKFDYKDGSFLFGRDQDEVTGDEIVVNTNSFCHGWILWDEGKPKKAMVSFVEQLPEPMQNSAAGDEPTEARSFEARFMDDEDTIIQFETSSYGGRKGCDSLLNEIRMKSASGETEFLFPVVKLDSDSYKAKKGGVIHNPVFNVVGWVNSAGKLQEQQKTLFADSAEAPEQTEEKEEAPVRRRRRTQA